MDEKRQKKYVPGRSSDPLGGSTATGFGGRVTAAILKTHGRGYPIMLLSVYVEEQPEKARGIRSATGSRCEHCSTMVPPAVLEIHVIGSPPDTGDAGIDLQKQLLVLCPSCRHLFHSGNVTVELQRELVRYRSRAVRNRMRDILGYRPPAYVPPGDFNPETVFREMLDSGALDLCLNGG
jgi:hypothetical protein